METHLSIHSKDQHGADAGKRSAFGVRRAQGAGRKTTRKICEYSDVISSFESRIFISDRFAPQTPNGRRLARHVIVTIERLPNEMKLRTGGWWQIRV